MSRCARLSAALLLLAACNAPAADERVLESVPDRAAFSVVAQVLIRHCGSLDCHGTTARNLRLYGNEGLRWSAQDRPLQPECTTADEAEQDYAAVVGLEPETLGDVVADGGARPERLTFVRKALGLEDHEGGTVLQTASDADVCLRSWLRGETERAACLAAIPTTSCF